MPEIGDLLRSDERVELLTVRPVDSTELLHGVGHGAFALGERSAGEAAAEPRPRPPADALQVPVAAEHERDAVPMREEEKLQRRLTARLGREVRCGVDRADAPVVHRRAAYRHPPPASWSADLLQQRHGLLRSGERVELVAQVFGSTPVAIVPEHGVNRRPNLFGGRGDRLELEPDPEGDASTHVVRLVGAERHEYRRQAMRQSAQHTP